MSFIIVRDLPTGGKMYLTGESEVGYEWQEDAPQFAVQFSTLQEALDKNDEINSQRKEATVEARIIDLDKPAA
jgi:hypothetical protein